MRIIFVALLIAALNASPADAKPRSGGNQYSSHASHAIHASRGSNVAPRTSRSAPGLARDKHNRIARSAKAKADFKRQQPCPSTGRSTGACPGYVIDHINPLKRGGADRPSNMQWQTKEAAREKDKTE